MRITHTSVLMTLFTMVIACPLYSQQSIIDKKEEVLKSVEIHKHEIISLSDQIWEFAETALEEYHSSELLADYAEQQGFTVQRGVAEMPTAFIATFGSGEPIIGIMGEFDALPGVSQKAVPYREVLHEGAGGHACGHNMFGAGSIGAAVAIKEMIEAGELSGTIRFYGTPAEEREGGKIYMARDGLFDDLDVCLDWHPYYRIEANMQSSQAISQYKVRFTGKSAHAAMDPWNGRSALDAAEFFTTGINALREHVKPSVRMHYVYTEAGNVPNVVPEKAEVWIWIRDVSRSGVSEVSERVKDIADGAALMAGVDIEVKPDGGMYEILVNETGARTLQKNLELIGPITYTEEETDFANKVMEEYGLEPKGLDGAIHPLRETQPIPPGGSSDVGDISHIVPEITLYATTAPAGAPWHSWIVVACGGMSIGHKGTLFASRALATTMVDLFEDGDLRKQIREEFLERKGEEVWVPMIPDGPPPVPDYIESPNHPETIH
jgi:aminobenzoyl-glutamate utilization protein B